MSTTISAPKNLFLGSAIFNYVQIVPSPTVHSSLVISPMNSHYISVNIPMMFGMKIPTCFHPPTLAIICGTCSSQEKRCTSRARAMALIFRCRPWMKMMVTSETRFLSMKNGKTYPVSMEVGPREMMGLYHQSNGARLIQDWWVKSKRLKLRVRKNRLVLAFVNNGTCIPQLMAIKQGAIQYFIPFGFGGTRCLDRPS